MSDLVDSFDHVPSSWSPSRGDESAPYSIKSILPPGRRRFLQLREPFMLLTEKSLARTAVLECALFELGRVLRGPESSPNDLEWREEQFALLTGPDPESCDLWAPLSDKFLEKRLLGLVKSRASVSRAIAWLADHGYLFRRRQGAAHNDRLVLPNIRKINYDQRSLPEYAGVKFKPVVTGSPDQMVEVPEGVILTPLYEGLVEAIREASGLDGIKVCRAALVLQRVLHRAKLRFADGQEVPVVWTARDLHSTFGWGRKENWLSALDLLISSGLLVRHQGNRVEPNLLRIHAICATPLPSGINVANVDTQGLNGGQLMPQTWTSNDANVDTQGLNGGHESVLKRTEIFSESLTEYLTEREPDPDFEPAEILASHSIEQFRERRAVHFSLVDVPSEWASLSFANLAEADEHQAAALLELANKMPSGERPAIAFLNNTDLTRALVSVLLGYWIDRHIGNGFRWINVTDYATTIAGEFSESRSREIARVENPTGPVVIENVAQARMHQQARDSLSVAIKAHREALMPIIFLGLPPRLSDLSSSLRGHQLADQIYRVLRERNRPVDHETGLDISNPFTELL